MFAFWELVYIAKCFEGRRKNIYEDIDRKGGSTWSQILVVCLDTIKGIDSRIAEYQDPKAASVKSVKEEPIPELPRLSPPLKDGLNASGDLFTSPPPPNSRGAGLIEAVGTFAKTHGQSPPQTHPTARKLLTQAEEIVLNQKQRDELAARGPSALFRDPALWVLHSRFGWPFRQQYRRKVSTVVLGSPYGDIGIIIDAIESLAQFAVRSLKEDKYGNVQRDVKLIIQTYTRTVMNLERFKNNIGIHWTDVEGKRESPESDILLVSLKSALNDLINAFGNYSEDLRLSQSEMRMAREAATPAQPEMQQVGI